MKAALGESSVTKPGQSQTLLYVYDALKLTVVFSGNPARVAVFGLGEEPR